MQSVTPTLAERNRQQNAVNLVARHLSDRPGRHIVRRVLGELVVWLVESQTDAHEVYTVTLERDGWPATTCSCPDHVYRHQTCKHIEAVALLSQPAQPAPVADAPAIKWTADERKGRRRTEPVEEI